ncbi:MAG: hypothetical protein JWM68_3126 [Verrucomicrobiales bacterium]|nr:hypothetical protein [Verrucomicrobiales bacterium]
MSKPRVFIGLTILLGLVGMIYWQQQIISKLRADIATLRSETAFPPFVPEHSAGSPVSEKETETVRKEHAELLRLRGEVTKLKQQAKEPSEEAAIEPAAPMPLVLTTNDLHHFATNLTAELKSNETLVTGGWDTADGKKTFVFVTPEFTNDKEIQLTARFAEIAVDKIGEDLNKYLRSGRISVEDTRGIVKRLENEEGVDFLSAPRVSTVNGRQAQVSVLQQVEIDGEKVLLGPALDFIPTIAADGASVSLGIQAAITTASATEAK